MIVTEKENYLVENILKMHWGESPSGFTKDMPDGKTQYITFVPTLGRRFVRGREIYHLPNETRLGDDFFLPCGAYCGRILS